MNSVLKKKDDDLIGDACFWENKCNEIDSELSILREGNSELISENDSLHERIEELEGLLYASRNSNDRYISVVQEKDRVITLLRGIIENGLKGD